MKYSIPKCTKIKPEWKRLKTVNTKIKRSRTLQKQKKTKTKKKRERKNSKTLKGPSSVEDIKAKMQASEQSWAVLVN